MPDLRLATFNAENLLMRCDFGASGIKDLRKKLNQVSDQSQAETIGDVFNVLSEDDRTLTAQALAATRADVCALQEVENLVTLTAFHDNYLSRWSRQPYDQHILHEGNDPRGIDVGILSRLQITAHTSHASKTFADLGIEPPENSGPNARVFRRDCLELDITKDGERLTLFVCHFKSMHGGREATRSVRQTEALAVRKLIEARFADPSAAKWVILGDLNDYLEIDGVADHAHGLGPLTEDGFATDIALACVTDPLERWSHHYAPLSQYTALDHILLSKAMMDLNQQAEVTYVRAGAPWRSERHRGYRLQGVGWSNPKASDHCPLVARLTF